MSDVLAALVALPVVAAAAVTLLARRVRGVGAPVAGVALLGQVGLAAWVAWRVATTGPLGLVVGDLPATLGIELAADRLSATVVALIAGTGLWGTAYLRRTGVRSATGYVLHLLLIAGLTGICVTRDVFNLYVFLEIAGLSAYALVALGDGRDAAPAALHYLLVGTVGASLYLLGVGYLYAATGTLNMGALATELAAVGLDGRLPVAALSLIVAGLAVKMALFPVHGWKPDAYGAAPPGVAAVLAALVSTVAAYALVRLLLSVFGLALLAAVPTVGTVLRVGAVVSVVAGAVLALWTPDVRRMLAYSGVSQFGIALGGIALGTPAGVVAGVVHLVGHAVLKAGAFAAAGLIERGSGARTVDDYAGAADGFPAASAALAALGLGLVGIPPLVGFFGKWYVVLAAVEAGAPVVAAAVLLSTLLSLSYFGRLIQRLYLEGRDDPDRASAARSERSTTSTVAVAATVATVAVGLALGLLSAELVEFLRPAAEVAP